MARSDNAVDNPSKNTSCKRGGKAHKHGLPAEQIPVLMMRDRSGVTSETYIAQRNRCLNQGFNSYFRT
ncbi:hypothetical protein AU255_00045 [Methyloprofundus sedimenti]|uniref:Uncharacterized protein n=1 Tax=Methyloprofundus sedimenti TaxID=1420851 RepID=A0A1V8M466_9GAMM|nr:hypothetical protein AU255_00045 [Methyloprofundus sedimenti]